MWDDNREFLVCTFTPSAFVWNEKKNRSPWWFRKLFIVLVCHISVLLNLTVNCKWRPKKSNMSLINWVLVRKLLIYPSTIDFTLLESLLGRERPSKVNYRRIKFRQSLIISCFVFLWCEKIYFLYQRLKKNQLISFRNRRRKKIFRE